MNLGDYISFHVSIFIRFVMDMVFSGVDWEWSVLLFKGITMNIMHITLILVYISQWHDP